MKLYDKPIEFRIYDVNGVVLNNPNDFISYIDNSEPFNFEAFTLKLERLKGKEDQPRHGFNFEYGNPETPITFIKAFGYELIQSLWEAKGNDAIAIIEMGVHEPTYSPEFKAFIDFNTYDRDWVNGEPRVTCNVESESIGYKLNSRLETMVNLLASKDLDGQAITPLVMEENFWHGKVVKKSSRFEGTPNLDLRYFDGAREYRENEIFFISLPQTEIFNDVGAFVYAIDEPSIDEPDMDGFFHLSAPDEGEYILKYKNAPTLSVDFYNNNSDGTDVVLELCYKVGEAGTIQVLQEERGTVATGNVFYTNYGALSSNGRVSDVDFEVEQSINLKKDDNLYVFYRYRQDPPTDDGLGNARRREFAFIPSGSVNGVYVPYIELEGFTAPTTTPVKTLNIFDAINRNLELTTGLRNVLASDFYESECGQKRWLTNGFKIRQFVTDDPEIDTNPQTNMKMILDSLQMIDDIGFGFEKDGEDVKVRMEESSFFYNDAEILTIDKNVFEYKESIADELIINEIVAQFNDFIDEELNTLDAFATKQEYLTPIQTKALKLELFSEFIADAYTIEYTRRKQFSDNPSEAWEYDDNIFIVDWVEITGLIGGSKPNRLNYQSNVFIGDDSIITFPIIIPELVDLTLISWTPITGPDAGNFTEYTVDTVVFDEVDNQTIITVVESTTQQAGNTEFIFGGGFSFKRPESDQSFENISNLISPATTYNLRMSLKRLMMKHAKWINSGLNYKENTDVIQRTFAKHNKGLVTQFRSDADCLGADLNRILLDEREDIQLSDLANFARYFIPLRVDYKAQLSFEDNEYLRKALSGQSPDNNNYGYIRIANEEQGFTKIYVNLHEYAPLSSIVEGWGYIKYDN